MASKLEQFIKRDIWRIRSRNLPRSKLCWFKPLRIAVLSLREFYEDQCMLRASALTFYSLLSIVPVFAMAFGMAKGFGFQNALERELLLRFQGQEEVIARVVQFARSLLENTKGSVIAGVGVALLFWAIIQLLGNIEYSFNHIWGVKKPRTFVRKISDYLSAMLICPLLFMVSSTTTVVIKSQVNAVLQKIAILGPIGPATLFSLQLLPYCVIWVLFTFIYMFMPNTRVSFRSAILAAVFAGTIYQVFQWGYVSFQVGVTKYNAVYGSFAALPLFLVWLQASWMLVLFGAEVSFAHQNEEAFEFEPDCRNVSYAFEKLITLRAVQLLVESFSGKGDTMSAAHIARILEAPIYLVRKILQKLVESGIVAETCVRDTAEAGYQPARHIDQLTIQYIIHSLEQHGIDNIPIGKSPELDKLAECLRKLGEAGEKSEANVLLKDLQLPRNVKRSDPNA